MKNDSFMKRFKNLTIECLEIVGRSVLLLNFLFLLYMFGSNNG